jgi:hypothetical protein
MDSVYIVIVATCILTAILDFIFKWLWKTFFGGGDKKAKGEVAKTFIKEAADRIKKDKEAKFKKDSKDKTGTEYSNLKTPYDSAVKEITDALTVIETKVIDEYVKLTD